MSVLKTCASAIADSSLGGIAWRKPTIAMSAPRPRLPSRFVPRHETALARLDDDQLIAYIVQAKKAKALESAETGMFMLLYRHEHRMRRRVQTALPEHLQHHSDAVAEWVLERVWKSALKLPVTGESTGEWVNWTKTAISRQVISFFRSSQGQALEQEQQWPDDRPDMADGSLAPDTIGVELDTDALAISLDYRAAVDAAVASLNVKHKAIIDAAYFEDRSSRDVGEEFEETYDNVDQIKKRFRTELRAQLVARGVWEK
jgi:RNA polymerase sigma factor (sigma-70 family)